MKRRTHAAAFKAKVALAAIRNDRTLAEIAAEYEVHLIQITKWKKQALEGFSSLFDDGRRKKEKIDFEAEKKTLYEEIGKLKMQLDWVKKKSGIEEKRILVDPGDPTLSIAEQCEALGLARSTFYYKPNQESQETLRIMRRIDEIYMNHPFYGYRRMTAVLNREGYVINEKRTLRLMRLMGIAAIYPKRNLSLGADRGVKYPYLLRGVTIEGCNYVWSTDITYIPMEKGFL